MTDLEEILVRLPCLSPADLEQVAGRISFLMGHLKLPAPKAAPTSPSAEDDMGLFALDILIEVLRAKGAEFASTKSLRKSGLYPSFQSKAGEVYSFLARSKLAKPEQRAIVYLGIELLYDHLTAMGIPVSSRTLMSHFHRLPAVLNAHFPGYAGAGLLHFIVQRDSP